MRMVLASLSVATCPDKAPGTGASDVCITTNELCLRRHLLKIVAARNAQLPPVLDMHLHALLPGKLAKMPQRAANSPDSWPEFIVDVLEAVTLALDELSYGLYRDLPVAAKRLTAEWLPLNGCVEAHVGRVQPISLDSAPSETVARESFIAAVQAWTRRRGDRVAAVVLADPSALMLNQPARELLVITQNSLSEEEAIRWHKVMCKAAKRAGGLSVPSLWHIPVYMLGWVTPSAGVLDLRAGGRVIAGDSALLSLLPPVTPSHLPPAEGLWRVAAAAGLLVRLWPKSGWSDKPRRAEILVCLSSVGLASEALLLARGRYRAHSESRRVGLVNDHEGRPDVMAALAAGDGALGGSDMGSGISDYREFARRFVLEVAQFCADQLMTWERPCASLSSLCRTWFAWAGNRVIVPAAGLALLGSAPPAHEPLALISADQLLGPQSQRKASWNGVRTVWMDHLATAEADGWPLLWEAAPIAGGGR